MNHAEKCMSPFHTDCMLRKHFQLHFNLKAIQQKGTNDFVLVLNGQELKISLKLFGAALNTDAIFSKKTPHEGACCTSLPHRLALLSL